MGGGWVGSWLVVGGLMVGGNGFENSVKGVRPGFVCGWGFRA